LLLVATLATAVADDWPQWMGPSRDNVWRESEIIKAFPTGGPKILWRTEIAGGFAGPAVADGKVFVTDYVTGDNVRVSNFDRKEFTGTERVLCLDESSGHVLWKHEYAVRYTISYPAGPRCTPNVDGNRVYTLGAEGHLFCFDILSGDVVWQKNLKQDYRAKTPLWGYAAHPLIDGNKLLTLAGGAGSHAVALNKLTGAEIWRTGTSPEQGYSPPTIIEHAGVRQLLLLPLRRPQRLDTRQSTIPTALVKVPNGPVERW
jgi:outer membrane protein assembly factor BamB